MGPEIGAFEAKDTVGSLLDRVSEGEEIVITRHGRPVARLVPESDLVDRERARRSAADILVANVGVTLGGLGLARSHR